MAQQDSHHVRAIALTPTQGLARRMTVENIGGPWGSILIGTSPRFCYFTVRCKQRGGRGRTG